MSLFLLAVSTLASSNQFRAVLSISGDHGYCNVTSDCWCTAEGATCNAATHRCSIVSH